MAAGDFEAILICFEFIKCLGSGGGERNDLVIAPKFWTSISSAKALNV